MPRVLYRVYRQLNAQKAFLQQELEPFLAQALAHSDGTVGEEDILKIRRYYGLAVPAILGEAFAALRGTPLSEKERKGCTWLGATTGLFDDFFENTGLTDSYIELLYRQPNSYTGHHSNEKMANQCWLLALKHCANADLLTDMAGLVHRTQSESRLQKNNYPGEQALRRITFDKGGYSVLFYMAFFYRHLPPEDERLFYHTGALLQLENDLFDVYKDQRDGISTLVTQCSSMAALRRLYLEHWQMVKQAIEGTSFGTKGKKRFLAILCGLVSRGLVCLDMLQRREAENGGHFDPSVFSRKQLICDMEKPANLLRTLHYYAAIM